MSSNLEANNASRITSVSNHIYDNEVYLHDKNRALNKLKLFNTITLISSVAMVILMILALFVITTGCSHIVLVGCAIGLLILLVVSSVLAFRESKIYFSQSILQDKQELENLS